MKMKKTLAILLAALLACGAFAVAAIAEEQDLFQYEVKADGTAEITGINDTDVTALEIPAELDGYPVTSVAGAAFVNCMKLRTAVIPEGVVSVGSYVFRSCPALESVVLPDSLVSMGRQIFLRCRNLKTVEVSPDHPVFGVENGALVNRRDQVLIFVLDRENAGTYTVAQGIRRIADFAFDCASFSSILLPDGVTEIGSHAFSRCGNLTEMIFPEGVTDIGTQAFLGSEKLESVTLPDSLARIGTAVFGLAPALAEVRISPDHPVYEMNGPLLVNRQDQEIVSVLNNLPAVCSIPAGIRTIGPMAFQGCGGLEELTVPEGVTKIRWSAFSGCDRLREITLPASLEDIGTDAFEYSKDLLIKAPAGSWAEQYAGENGYTFEALPAETDGAD